MRTYIPNRMAFVAMMAVLATFAVDSPARAGSTTTLFEIQIDSTTAGLATGPGGLLDMQLNPSTVPSSANVTATVFNLSTDLTLGAPMTTGDASGQLQPGTSDKVTLDNGKSYNDLNQTANLPAGSYLDVFVAITVTDPTATGSSGTAFFLNLYDSKLSDASATATLTIQADGSVTQSMTAGITITSVPEPSTLAMLGLGLSVIAMVGRRRRVA